MMTGTHPWKDFTNQMALMYHVATTTELPPFPDKLSCDARDFLCSCFHRDPAQRWSAEELLRHPLLV